MICIALFATVATIIRQIIHTYGRGSLYALPIIGYLAAVVTIIGGICMFTRSTSTSSFVAGHVVAGVGLITTCVANRSNIFYTFFIDSCQLKMIGNGIPEGAFTKGQERILKTIAITISLIAWIWAFVLLAKSDVHPAYFVAGHVMVGLACICTSLIALVATIARQIRNVYTDRERKKMAKTRIVDGNRFASLGTVCYFFRFKHH